MLKNGALLFRHLHPPTLSCIAISGDPPLYLKGQAPPIIFLLGKEIPAKSKGADNSKVTDNIFLSFIRSII